MSGAWPCKTLCHTARVLSRYSVVRELLDERDFSSVGSRAYILKE